MIYLTHYDDETKIGKSAVADLVNLCKEMSRVMSDEDKAGLTDNLVIQDKEIFIKKDAAHDASGSGYLGTGEPSTCPDGENFCLPLIPGVNYPIMFSILVAVLMAEFDGKSVNPGRVKFKVKIPDVENYSVDRVMDAYTNMWNDYDV